MAASPTKSNSPAWDRLRSRFLRVPTNSPAPEDPPQRQGLAIGLSVMISCILWFTFTMQEEYVRVIQLPTTVQNLPADRALAELPPRSVRVEVQGPGWQLFGLFGLFGLDSDVPAIPIDASQDQVNLEAVVQSIPMKKNVLIRSVSPSLINLRKEQRIMKRIPVELTADIDTPPTHDFIQPPTLIPDSVAVAGARSVVADLTSWPTLPYENLDVRDTLRMAIPLVDTLEGLVTRSPDAVLLEAVAAEFTEAIREIDVPVRGIPSTDRLVRLDPPTIRVRYRVPLSQYDAAQQAPDFYAEVAYEDILRDTTGRVRPELHLPEDLDIRDVDMFPPTLRAYQIVE